MKYLYKRIIKKLGLSTDQLITLRDGLTVDKICAGPFVQDGKMCPNTSALALKLGLDRFENSSQVREQLRKFGIKKYELYIFYLLFDVPAQLSQHWASRLLDTLRVGLTELIGED